MKQGFFEPLPLFPLPMEPTAPPFRIWIAEDDDEFRETLGKSLAGDLRIIQLYSDGRELVESLNKDQVFDIVIADLLMPGTDGLHVLEAAKKCNPEGVVIIMTGYASLDTAVQAIRGGAYDYIRKPFKLDEIEIIVKNACEKIALTRENRRLLKRLENLEQEKNLTSPPRTHFLPQDTTVAGLDSNVSELNVFLKQMIPSEYDLKGKDRQEKTFQNLQKLIEYKREGLLNDAEFLAMKKILFQKSVE